MSWWTTYYQSSDKRIPAVSKATPRLRVPINRPDDTLTAVTEFRNMKTYEILSETADGDLVAVVSTEAVSDADARNQTARFCEMMDIEVHSVREAF